jgi:serine phosphatase RsbU (regulator of sigma subunit)
MFTDGVTESQNKVGEYYGEEGLKRSLESFFNGLELPNTSAQLVLEAAFRDMQDFLGDQPLLDDTTIMILLRNA